MFKFSPILLAGAILFASACTKKKNFDDKVLNVVVAAKVKGLDPVNAGDTYSAGEIARVYEGLLEYHYLKRPFTLQPNLADGMPTVSKDGLTYTFKIKKGILFHDNKCFPGGKGRELLASDFVYSIKRMADKKNNSTGWWLLDDRIAGLNKWRDAAKTDYAADVVGLKAIDSHTLQFKLSSKYPQFLYSLAMVYTFAVPKEAVEHYGLEFLNNPVGTGAFVTGTYTQSNTINYTKNPTYRDVFYPTVGSEQDKKLGLLNDAGKKLPLVSQIKVVIQTEASTRWLAFENGDVDYSAIPKDSFDSVVVPGKGITDTYAKRGITLEITPDLDITYTAFNHDNPLFKNNVKLKQAMSMAYDHVKANKLFYNGTGVIAQGIIPPGIAGYDKNYVNPYKQFNIEKAKKLLAEAGFPGGKGLPTIIYDTTSTTVNRQMSEFLAKQFAQIGIKLDVVTNTWPQLTQKVKKRQVQMYGMAWLGDYPDAENFLQLLWGKNAAPGPNGGNFNDKYFNEQFVMAKNMQPGPARAAIYKKLNEYLSEQVPLILGVHRTSFVTKHSWFKNYKFSTFNHGHGKFYDVDMNKKKEVIESGKLKNKAVEKKTAATE